jgi:hypothetical protein
VKHIYKISSLLAEIDYLRAKQLKYNRDSAHDHAVCLSIEKYIFFIEEQIIMMGAKV